jgi:hypothetical protein
MLSNAARNWAIGLLGCVVACAPVARADEPVTGGSTLRITGYSAGETVAPALFPPLAPAARSPAAAPRPQATVPVSAAAGRGEVVAPGVEPLTIAPERLPAEATPQILAGSHCDRSHGCDPRCGGPYCHPGMTHGLRYHWYGHTKPYLMAKSWGYPRYFCEPPLGAYVYPPLNAQVAGGLQAQLVLYRYDFYSPLAAADTVEASDLNAAGQRQLMKITGLLHGLAAPPVLIETSGDLALDEARRGHVIAELSHRLGAPVPMEWVVVADLPRSGLSGTEATIIYQNLLQRTQQMGVLPSQMSGEAALTTPIEGGLGAWGVP